MLNQVLREMESIQGTVRLEEIAARLNLEPAALEGMIAFWVSKGRLAPASVDGDTVACTTACAGACPAAEQCPFVAKLPRMWQRTDPKGL